MTTGKVADDVTSGGSAGNVNIGMRTGHTADHAVVDTERDSDDIAKAESSGLTSRETARRLPSSSVRASERDALMAKFRAAQASALFDPEAMALLEFLSKKPLFDFGELAEKVLTPVMWVKLAVLVRAYLVEPLDNGVRVTPEGSQALKRVSSYLSRLDVENEGSDLGKGL